MSDQLRPAVSAEDHTRGAKSPQLSIVEYGDFQCPYCGDAEPIVAEIMDQFGEAIALSFRNFPLKDVHEFAVGAALAAEAAAEQGKYWEMHELLFDHQDRLNPEDLRDYAQQLGLDLNAFEKAMASTKLADRISSDFESGARSGVNGTPTFFVNGTRFDGGAADLYALIKENVS
jgi:protein-disulfide isomerase